MTLELNSSIERKFKALELKPKEDDYSDIDFSIIHMYSYDIT